MLCPFARGLSGLIKRGFKVIIIIIIIIIIYIFLNNEKFFLTTRLTIKILFTINSLEKKKRENYSFKTLFTIPVDLKST